MPASDVDAVKIHPALRVPPTKTLAEQIDAMQRRRDEARAGGCTLCGGVASSRGGGAFCRVCYADVVAGGIAAGVAFWTRRAGSRGATSPANGRWSGSQFDTDAWNRDLEARRLAMHPHTPQSIASANSTTDSPATSEWLPAGCREPLGLVDRVVERADRFGPIHLDGDDWRSICALVRAEWRDHGTVANALNKQTVARWVLDPARDGVIVGPGPISTWRPRNGGESAQDIRDAARTWSDR